MEELLSIINKKCIYHISPWKVEHMIEKCKFEVKTKKEFLTKTGKEGNLVLFHDCFKKEAVWWKDITVERIIENLPKEQPEAELVL